MTAKLERTEVEIGLNPTSEEIISAGGTHRFELIIDSAEGPEIIYDRKLAAERARKELERLRALGRSPLRRFIYNLLN